LLADILGSLFLLLGQECRQKYLLFAWLAIDTLLVLSMCALAGLWGHHATDFASGIESHIREKYVAMTVASMGCAGAHIHFFSVVYSFYLKMFRNKCGDAEQGQEMSSTAATASSAASSQPSTPPSRSAEDPNNNSKSQSEATTTFTMSITKDHNNATNHEANMW
jgi:hypothetical protein